MTDLIVRENNLPATIEDLSKFVMFNDEKIKAVRAALSAMHKLKAPRNVLDLKLREAQELSEQVALAKIELGKRISELPKHTNNNPTGNNQHKGQIDTSVDSTTSNQFKPKSEVIAELGFTQKQAEHFQQMAKNPDVVNAAMTKAREAGDVVSQAQILKEINQAKRKEEIQRQVDDIDRRALEQPTGLFDVIVIDPPWSYGDGHLYHIDGWRVSAPYPEMTQDELKAIELPAADNCVLCVWTTNQFIWDAKELIDHWGFKYRFMFVWNKQQMGVGRRIRMQCEFCLVALKGEPVFKDVHNIRDLIEEPRREHSRKPEKFYEITDSMFAGRKLDYFSRTQREGWTTYGNDTAKFGVA